MKRIVILAIAIAMMVPGIAFGANPTCGAYNPQLCGSVTTGTDAGTTSAQASSNTLPASSNTLPFTGLDAGLVVAAGAVLMGSGFVIRRLSRRMT